MKTDPKAIPLERFIAFDVHKHYVLVGGMNPKKGVGSALTINCVYDAFDKGVKFIFLQTEKGSYNEKYYNKLGFNTKFVGKGFVLENTLQ